MSAEPLFELSVFLWGRGGVLQFLFQQKKSLKGIFEEGGMVSGWDGEWA